MEPKKGNTVQDFFDNLPSEDKEPADIFDENKVAPVAKPEQGAEEAPVKNRRHRRLEEQLDKEREARIIAEAKLEARTEVQRFSEDTTTDEISKKLVAMYGNDAKGLVAVQLHRELLRDAVKEAKDEAVREVQESQAQSVRERKEYESFIDEQLEHLEDEYKVDLTSDSPSARKARREFLETVQLLSSKDEDGNIKEFADFDGAYGVYELKKQQSKGQNTERKADLASRSMTKSGSGASQERQPTPGFRGWQQDYGL